LSRCDLTEVEWRMLRVLLPHEREPGKRGRDRPPQDNRNVINGILWRLRTGAPWRDVFERYRNWNSNCRRFPRWSASGGWKSVAVALPRPRFSRPRRGSRRKGGGHRRALGRSWGGFTNKNHCLGNARGRPITLYLNPRRSCGLKGQRLHIKRRDCLSVVRDGYVSDIGVKVDLNPVGRCEVRPIAFAEPCRRAVAKFGYLKLAVI